MMWLSTGRRRIFHLPTSTIRQSTTSGLIQRKRHFCPPRQNAPAHCMHSNQQEALKPYSYASIIERGAPHIRLVELLPGRYLDPIAVKIIEVPLSARLQYEALSYCWGSSDDISSIICDGRRLQIPKRLLDALRNVRYKDRQRTVWADAICINQLNVAEKESQVGLMRDIFEMAQQTIIFLGSQAERRAQKMSHFALLSLKAGLALFRRRNLGQNKAISHRSRSQKETILSPFSFNFYFDVIRMLRVPWFQRAWVVQEVAVARKATIYWGSAQYDWDAMLNTLKYMSEVNFPLAFIVTLGSISSIEEERRLYRNVQTSLNAVLLRHQRCIATDPRDKIYSFCGLVKAPIDIRYEHDVSTIYRETALKIMEEDRTLDLLSPPATSRRSASHRLPSWVPDWSISSSSALAYAWGHGPLSIAGTELQEGRKRRFATAKQSTYVPSSNTPKNILAICGYTFDKALYVGSAFEGVQLPQEVRSVPKIIREWMKCASSLWRARRVFIEWARIAQIRNCSQYKTGESMREAFLQTVSVSELHESERVRIELQLWERGTRFPFGLLYSCFILIWHFLTDRPFLLFDIQGRYALQRRLIRTESGYLGLASSHIRPGDCIAICNGSTVPLVLRKMRNGEQSLESYTLVGDAYVHGIMMGEKYKESKCRKLYIH